MLQQMRLRGDHGGCCIDAVVGALRSGFWLQEVPYDCVVRMAGESNKEFNLFDYFISGHKFLATVWQQYRNDP